MTSYVGYARVSTEGQGRSGLGLEAQEATIRRHLRDDDKMLMPIMVEVESGRKADRPVLTAALARCRLVGATLLVAKLDRLARNRAFVGTVMASGVPVEFCDIPASKGATGAFILGIMAEVAQLEAGLISERTKAALQSAKAKGTWVSKAGKVCTGLGGYRGGPVPDGKRGAAANRQHADAFASRVAPLVNEMRAAGKSLDAIAGELTSQGIVTPRGGVWTATGVRRVLARAV